VTRSCLLEPYQRRQNPDRRWLFCHFETLKKSHYLLIQVILNQALLSTQIRNSTGLSPNNTKLSFLGNGTTAFHFHISWEIAAMRTVADRASHMCWVTWLASDSERQHSTGERILGGWACWLTTVIPAI
jgi:hypothetical protein